MKKKLLVVGVIGLFLLAGKVYACCLNHPEENVVGNNSQALINGHHSENVTHYNCGVPNCNQVGPHNHQQVEYNHHTGNRGHHGWHHR